jgi:hypothetical protein
MHRIQARCVILRGDESVEVLIYRVVLSSHTLSVSNRVHLCIHITSGNHIVAFLSPFHDSVIPRLTPNIKALGLLSLSHTDIGTVPTLQNFEDT